MNLFRNRVVAVAAGAAVVVGLGGTAAVADQLIGSKDIAKNAVLGKHIAPGAVKESDLAAAVKAKLNAAGTPGAQGPAGPAGEKGATGAAGKDGVNGKDGLNGKDGAAGKDGLNGKDGKDGAAGAAGADGKDGLNGKDGLDGKDGQAGAQGPAGADGQDGADGAQGPAGPVGPAGALNFQFAQLAEAKTITTIGGPINTNFTNLDTKITLAAGTYVVNVSGSFISDQAAAAGSPDVYPQLSLWLDKNKDNQYSWQTEGDISPNALMPRAKNRHISVSGTSILVLTEATDVKLLAFGYDADQQSNRSGEIKVDRAVITAAKIA